MIFTIDGKRALVCYGDGTMRMFDLKSGQVLHNFTGNSGHDVRLPIGIYFGTF